LFRGYRYPARFYKRRYGAATSANYLPEFPTESPFDGTVFVCLPEPANNPRSARNPLRPGIITTDCRKWDISAYSERGPPAVQASSRGTPSPDFCLPNRAQPCTSQLWQLRGFGRVDRGRYIHNGVAGQFIVRWKARERDGGGHRHFRPRFQLRKNGRCGGPPTVISCSFFLYRGWRKTRPHSARSTLLEPIITTYAGKTVPMPISAGGGLATFRRANPGFPPKGPPCFSDRRQPSLLGVPLGQNVWAVHNCRRRCILQA